MSAVAEHSHTHGHNDHVHAEAGLAPAPIIFTDSAAAKVADLVAEEGNPDLKLRVFVQGGGCSGETALTHVDESDSVICARLYRRQGNAYNVQRRLHDMLPVYEKAIKAFGQRTSESTIEWIDLQLDRIWLAYFQARADDLSLILQESQQVIEARKLARR